MQSASRKLVDAFPRLAQQAQVGQVRHMSGHGSAEDHLKAMKLWTYITFAAVPSVAIFGIYTCMNEHEHGHHAPDYPYLKKLDKKYPWGSKCNLFDFTCTDE